MKTPTKPYLRRFSNVEKELHDKFIAPFVYWAKRQFDFPVSAERLWDEFFHVNTRHIQAARATTNFFMPGKFILNSRIHLENHVDRHVKTGTNLCIRFDLKENKIDIEIIPILKKLDNRVFTLTQEQFQDLKSRCIIEFD